MRFCFLNLRQALVGHGLEPDFPEGVSFLLLSGLRNVSWGLYSFEPLGLNSTWEPATTVEPDFAALIHSGMRYPPALALARLETQRLFRDGQPSQQEFALAYAESLRRRLSQQAEAPFLVARALKDELVDLAKGEWYWVLRVKGHPRVADWVSVDYFVYQRPAIDFELSEDQLERLRANEADQQTR